MTATARDGPHEQVPDVTCDLRWISGKVGCAGANRREGTQGTERQEGCAGYNLRSLSLVCVLDSVE